MENDRIKYNIALIFLKLNNVTEFLIFKSIKRKYFTNIAMFGFKMYLSSTVKGLRNNM